MTRRALPAVVLIPLLVVALVVSSSACGTLSSFSGPTHDRHGDPVVPPPYSGVIEDAEAIWESKATDNIAIAIFDLPISAAADTLLLPVTIFLNMRAYVIRELAAGPQSSR